MSYLRPGPAFVTIIGISLRNPAHQRLALISLGRRSAFAGGSRVARGVAGGSERPVTPLTAPARLIAEQAQKAIQPAGSPHGLDRLATPTSSGRAVRPPGWPRHHFNIAGSGAVGVPPGPARPTDVNSILTVLATRRAGVGR